MGGARAAIGAAPLGFPLNNTGADPSMDDMPTTDEHSPYPPRSGGAAERAVEDVHKDIGIHVGIYAYVLVSPHTYASTR